MQVQHNDVSLKRVRKRMAIDTDRHDFMHYFLKRAKTEQLANGFTRWVPDRNGDLREAHSIGVSEIHVFDALSG